MQVLMTPSRVVWGRRGTEGLAGGWWVLGKARDLCCLSYRNFPLSLFPSFPLSLFPSFPLSLFPSFPLSLFPSFPLSLFPSFPLSLFPSFPLSLFPSFPLSLSFPEYLCHVYVRSDGLAGVVIADNEYPQRVCFTLLDKVLDEFSRQVSKMDWPSGSPATISYSALDGYLSKYQVQTSETLQGTRQRVLVLPAALKMAGEVGSTGTCWDPGALGHPHVPVVMPVLCCFSPEPPGC
uniref:YKT6 v-SNARE homolog n=1 Tax=Ficedula albicollis TaxID=59894 RepID=A0A803VWG5_FICAL